MKNTIRKTQSNKIIDPKQLANVFRFLFKLQIDLVFVVVIDFFDRWVWVSTTAVHRQCLHLRGDLRQAVGDHKRTDRVFALATEPVLLKSVEERRRVAVEVAPAEQRVDVVAAAAAVRDGALGGSHHLVCVVLRRVGARHGADGSGRDGVVETVHSVGGKSLGGRKG